MTYVLKLNLDMVKMYHQAKNEDSTSNASKVTAQTDTQIDRQTNRHKNTDRKTHAHRYCQDIRVFFYSG